MLPPAHRPLIPPRRKPAFARHRWLVGFAMVVLGVAGMCVTLTRLHRMKVIRGEADTEPLRVEREILDVRVDVGGRQGKVCRLEFAELTAPTSRGWVNYQCGREFKIGESVEITYVDDRPYLRDGIYVDRAHDLLDWTLFGVEILLILAGLGVSGRVALARIRRPAA